MINSEDVKNIANGVEPEYKVHLYCYKDKAVNRYAPPFVNEKEPKYMVDGLKTSIIKGQHVKELTGLCLCYIGEFELREGISDFAEKPIVLVDCDVLIEKVSATLGGSGA